VGRASVRTPRRRRPSAPHLVLRGVHALLRLNESER
jgi:hypothetical protein